MIRTPCRFVAGLLAAIFLFVSLPVHTVRAELVSTGEVVAAESGLYAKSELSADRDRVRAYLSREDVRQELEALGIDPDEAAARVDALSDAEIQQIAERMDEMPAGQGGLGIIVGAALIVFIILLITDIACVTKVFPFTRCAQQ